MKTVFCFHLRLHCLRSAYDLVKVYQIVGVRSRSRGTKPIRKHGNMHCDWFILLLLLPTSTIWFSLDHRWNVSDRVVSGVGRNGNVLILLTPIPSRLWFLYDSHFLFSLGFIMTLMTPLTTLSLLKTSLYGNAFSCCTLCVKYPTCDLIFLCWYILF